MRFGILRFPGTWSEVDCHYAVSGVLGQGAEYVWHQDGGGLDGFEGVILPGGFSYGDYLRPGAMARFSPVMEALYGFAAAGGTVIGICNGFQILCEAGLLPGALRANRQLEYRCQWTNLRVERSDTRFTAAIPAGRPIQVPISHGEGNYYADAATLESLEREGRVLFRYCDAAGQATDAANPNGSSHNIAGIVNESGNVLGMMPHPERCCEALLGGTDGALIFQSIIDYHNQSADRRGAGSPDAAIRAGRA